MDMDTPQSPEEEIPPADPLGASGEDEGDGEAPGLAARNLNIGRIPEGEIDALPTMRLIEDRTAMLFGQELGHAFQAHIEARVEDTRLQKWNETIDHLESPGCYNMIELEALGGHAVIAIEQNLFFNLLELLFGLQGDDASMFVHEPRERFSSVEERVIRRVVHLFGRSMEVAWRPVIPMNVAHLRIETKPNNVSIGNRDDAIVVTDYTVTLPSAEGRVQLMVPKALLMGFRERLSTGRYEKTPQHKESWKNAITENVQGVRVDVTAELGCTHLTLQELLHLAEGQVLRLDTSPQDPVTVKVSGVPKFTGRGTVHHGNLAIELEDIT